MEPIKDTRICIYPAYIDAGKTVAEGRRIPKELAVENPGLFEIHESCAKLQLKSQMEDKTYPRDYMQRGRVRVALKDESGKYLNKDITSRRALLIKISETVPTTDARAKAAQLNPTIPVIQGVAMPNTKEKAKAEDGEGGGKVSSGKKGKKGRR